MINLTKKEREKMMIKYFLRLFFVDQFISKMLKFGILLV